MAKIYSKLFLVNEIDVKKATRSIYNNCRELKRAKNVKNIFTNVTDNGDLYIIRTLLHCQKLVQNSIEISNNVKLFEGYKKNSDILISVIQKTYLSGKDKQKYKPVPIKVISNFIRYHTKSFRVMRHYKLHKPRFVLIHPDNLEWEKALFASIVIWPNSEFFE